jgi:glycosyltransferase involved in cell wall biosynthesis
MKGNSPADLVAKLPQKLRHRVHFTGHVRLAELEELLRGASLLAYPSRAEGFGLPPLEAMSVGVPVVAADTPVAREVYGKAALYAPPNDVEAWADSITLMLTDEPTRRKLTAAGLKRSALFTWERCAEECVALYRQLLV